MTNPMRFLVGPGLRPLSGSASISSMTATDTRIANRTATYNKRNRRYDIPTTFGTYSVYTDEITPGAVAVVLADTHGITFDTRENHYTVTDAAVAAERLAARPDTSEVIVAVLDVTA